MKVKQLIEMLEGFDEDLEVGFEYPSRDYWNSVLIGEVYGAEEGYAKYSAYHQQLGVATEDEIEEAEYLANLDDPDEEGDIPEDKQITRMVILK